MKEGVMPPEDDKQQEDEPQTLEDALKYAAALKKRLAERDADNQKLKGEVSDYGKRLKAIEDGQQSQLQEQGNYKALAEKLQADLAVIKPKAERAESLEAVIRSNNEATIARIPEGRRGLVPTDYPPEKLQSWLATNGGYLLKEPAPDFNAGDGAGDGKPPSQLTDAERNAAKLMGVKPETMEALKARDANK